MFLMIKQWPVYKNSVDTAAFVKQVTRLIKIINVKSPHTGTRLNDDDRRPITDPEDPRLTFMHQMATCFKEMDNGLRGRRIRGLTSNTANAFHHSLNDLIQIIRQFLSLGMPYVLPGKLHLIGWKPSSVYIVNRMEAIT